jgi:thioredoxin reductase
MEELDIPVDSRKITGIFGDDKFQGVHFEDGKEEMDGLMIAEGTSGSLDFANSLGLRVKDGNVVVDENQFTGMPNVYAAGDCTPGARQIGAAVGEGSEAAINLINDIRGKQHVDWRH